MAYFFCITGLIQHIHCVTYELTATPYKVAVGHSLTISAKLNNPSDPLGDVKISLAKTISSANIFSTRGGCRFIGDVYNSGRIDVCDYYNYRFVITFPSVTANHTGAYTIFAPLQSPYQSDSVEVQLLGKWNNKPIGAVQVSFARPGTILVIFDNRLSCHLISFDYYIKTGRIDLCDEVKIHHHFPICQ
jgi:hypothetical protein